MKILTKTTLFSSLVILCLGIAPLAVADHGKNMGMMHHGRGMDMTHYGGSWKASLTDEQIKQIAKLKLDYKKKKYPLKTKMKQAKIELALLMTSDKPSQKAISKKIDQLVKLKSQKLHLKANHKIAVRKLLNEDQRVKFDMKILKRAYHGKKSSRYSHHGRH